MRRACAGPAGVAAPPGGVRLSWVRRHGVQFLLSANCTLKYLSSPSESGPTTSPFAPCLSTKPLGIVLFSRWQCIQHALARRVAEQVTLD